jgi:hypothetical protein
MTILQFSLFFAALLIGYVLLHLRLVRFEAHLREIAGLKLLNERLQGVSQTLERVRLDRTEEALGLLHDDLVALNDAAARVERLLRQEQEAASPRAGSPEAVAAAPPARLRQIVEDRLLSLGYGNLRILTDLTGATLEDQRELIVECEKGHMPCKGKVVTRNGAIIDVQLQTVARTFP